MALIIKRPVVLKSVVTPAFKQQLMTELENALRQIEIWLEQQEFQSRRMIAEVQKQNPRRVNQVREEIRQERAKQEQVKSNIEQKLEQVKRLEIDSLFVTGTFDAPVRIEVGDDIRTKLFQAEIIIKDGIVVQLIE